MFRPSPTPGLPTWVAIPEPESSGDEDSEMDEVDQIHQSPRPRPVSDRPTTKRKESDKETEPSAKRARHEKPADGGSERGPVASSSSVKAPGVKRSHPSAMGFRSGQTSAGPNGLSSSSAPSLPRASSAHYAIPSSTGYDASKANAAASKRSATNPTPRPPRDNAQRPFFALNSKPKGSAHPAKPSPISMPPPALPGRARPEDIEAITRGEPLPPRTHRVSASASLPTSKTSTSTTSAPSASAPISRPRVSGPIVPTLTQRKPSSSSTKKADIPSSLKPELFSKTLSSKKLGKRKASIPTIGSGEVIEISDDEEPTVNKSKSKGKAKKPWVPPSGVDIIELIDSDEEPPKKVSPPTAHAASTSKLPEKRLSSPKIASHSRTRPRPIYSSSEEDDRMVVDTAVPAESVSAKTVTNAAVAQTSPSVAKQLPSNSTTATPPPSVAQKNVISCPSSTTASPPKDKGKSKEVVHSPVLSTPGASSSSRTATTKSPSAAKKAPATSSPNRHGKNPLPSPINAVAPPPPPKHQLQTAVKTSSSQSLKERFSYPAATASSSSEPSISPTGSGASGSGSGSTSSREGSGAEAALDMRGLDAALGIDLLKKKERTPPQAAADAPIKQQLVSPEIPSGKHAARKSTGARRPRDCLAGPSSKPYREVGNCAGTAIDLTSDGEEAATGNNKPDSTAKAAAPNANAASGASASANGTGSGSSIAGPPPVTSTQSQFSAPQRPLVQIPAFLPTSSRSSTDELALRSNGAEPSPPRSLSPLPTSPPPPPTPAVESPLLAPAIASASGAAAPPIPDVRSADTRRNSAPALGEPFSLKTRAAGRMVSSPLGRSANSPRVQSPLDSPSSKPPPPTRTRTTTTTTTTTSSPRSPPLPTRPPPRGINVMSMPQLPIAEDRPQLTSIQAALAPKSPEASQSFLVAKSPSSSSVANAKVSPSSEPPKPVVLGPLSPSHQHHLPEAITTISTAPVVESTVSAKEDLPDAALADKLLPPAAAPSVPVAAAASFTIVPAQPMLPGVAVRRATSTPPTDEEAVEVLNALVEDSDSSMDDLPPEEAHDLSEDADDPPAEEADDEMDLGEKIKQPSVASVVEQQISLKRLSIRLPGLAASSRQRDSSESALNEAGPSRGSISVSASLRRSSRITVYSSASEEGNADFFDDDARFSDSVPASRSTTPEESAPLSLKSKTLGGFTAVSWDALRKNPESIKPKIYYNRDLPHSLQDNMNRLPQGAKMLMGNRDVYEAMMLENAHEECVAPIKIINNVDDEPTPPWEFFYSNEIWHGKDVPDPDFTKIISCDCIGECNPKSKTCACVKRQRATGTDDPGVDLDFIYDRTGKLKAPGYPIFECNYLCGCNEECRNRVIQHGRRVEISLQKTKNRGWGVFNGSPKKILRGTFIGIYSGELLTSAEAEVRGKVYNKFGRTYLFDIDFYHLKGGDVEAYTVDAYHAGNNHSCDPNSRLYAAYINEHNIEKPLLAIFSIRDIEPGEEICFSYSGNYPGDEDDEDKAKAKEPEGTAAKDIIYEKCLCGARNCTGIMFKEDPQT